MAGIKPGKQEIKQTDRREAKPKDRRFYPRAGRTTD
jgi:hypothetical protein